MKDSIVLRVALIVALIGFVLSGRRGRNPGDGETLGEDEIEYRGELIKLSRRYATYEEYKDDPNNLAKSELERVQKLVSEAPISWTFASSHEVSRAVMDVKFPGYGLSSRQGITETQGTSLSLYSIEIPAAAKNRILTFRRSGGAYELLDDFIWPDDPLITNVREARGQLLYLGSDERAVVIRSPIQHR